MDESANSSEDDLLKGECVVMDKLKYYFDAAALANVVATLVGWLPAIAAGLSIIWTAIQIYQWYKARKS